jgi:hypothetical protein
MWGMTEGKEEGFLGLCRFEESCGFEKEPSELEAFDDRVRDRQDAAQWIWQFEPTFLVLEFRHHETQTRGFGQPSRGSILCDPV